MIDKILKKKGNLLHLLLVALKFVLYYNSKISQTLSYGVVTTKNVALQSFYED